MAKIVRDPFAINDHVVEPGKKAQFEIPIARLMSGTEVSLPVQVLHGRRDGPIVWLSGAVHGDELCGVEIVRQILSELSPRTMAGTVIALPIVNVHGFNTGDRYFPDRRDLNRSFPGSARGPLASRVAHLVMKEVVSRSNIGIDFHTGSDHRTNLPQIRANLDDEATLEMVKCFGAPIAIHAKTRDGSLRQAATEAGATVLLYEGGEALRFDRDAIAAGRDGALRVLGQLGIIESIEPAAKQTLLSRRSAWVRATKSGIVHPQAELGSLVSKGDVLATILDAFGRRRGRVTSRRDGLVIGQTQHPLVNQGDAITHIAEF